MALLLPLAEELGVSVTELLRGERTGGNALPAEEVEALVGSALRLTAEERAEQGASRRRWRLACVLCALAGAGETLLLRALGVPWGTLGMPVLLVEGLCLLFALWLCFGVKERLPAYYDSNKISFYSDGIFCLNLSGVRLNNSNWPHVLKAMRLWLLGAMAAFPAVWGAAVALWPGRADWLALPLTLIFCLGLFVPAIAAAKKYE